MSLTLNQLDTVLNMEIPNGDAFVKDGNEFTGYTIAVSKLDQIKDSYLKLRLLHPRARHIICAYMINDSTILEQDHKGFCDDDEVGAGRILLNFMEFNELQNRAIFVIRYFGHKIGNDRLKCIKEAAKSAVENNPFNRSLAINQELKINKPI